jgi:hypothetical protein
VGWNTIAPLWFEQLVEAASGRGVVGDLGEPALIAPLGQMAHLS